MIAIGSLQECSTKENPFSFDERKTMLEAALAGVGIKNYRIFGLPDFKDDSVWTNKFLQLAGSSLDEAVVFSLNPWTKKCCEKVGIKVMEQPSFFDQLSATQIREKIFKEEEWESLVPKEISEYLKSSGKDQKIKNLQMPPEERIIDFIKQKVKEAGAKGAVIGISGGIDSAVAAVLAKKALGKKILCLSLPFSKKNPFKKNVSALERSLKIKIAEKPIEEMFKAIEKRLPKGPDLARGNIQSRIRMVILYHYAGINNYLVLGTTNRSEMEIGYFTKYGDGGVDMEPIADIYKTDLYPIAKRIGVPKEILGAIPTAGLWAGQTDEKELGLSYFQLDTILKLLSQEFSKEEISFLTGLSKRSVEKIEKRRSANAHKLSLPPACKLG
jgi:NAD+ synthase